MRNIQVIPVIALWFSWCYGFSLIDLSVRSLVVFVSVVRSIIAIISVFFLISPLIPVAKFFLIVPFVVI